MNLIADDYVVEELIQENFNINRLCLSLKNLIENRSITLQKYKFVRENIGSKNASKEVSNYLINELNT